MAQTFVNAAVLREVRRLPEHPRLRVLDLSCGRGEILRALRDDGCEVRGTHYRSDDYKLAPAGARELLAELPIDEGVDLLEPLPYPASSFDLVVLSEILEHLPTPIPVLGEIGRLLVPGGRLVLSTPNLSRLHSRLHFFWTGTHKLIRRRVGWDLGADELYAYHIDPVDFPLLHTLLFQAGLRVERLGWTRFKPGYAGLLALYPLIWLATRVETRRRVGRGIRRRGEDDLFRWLVHPAMLASEQLLLVARKIA
jgi:SAM-dependent methyltransferase